MPTLKKEEIAHINNTTLQGNRKKKKTKSNVNGRKEIRNIKTEIIENRKIKQNKT